MRALILLLILGTLPVGQTPTRLSVDVRLVNIVATVSDKNGKYVSHLTAEDFVVEEDGVPQKISHFSQDHDVPVSVGILLDTSGSMERKIRTASEAVDRFINNVHKDDDIFLMTFDRDVKVVQDFTSDRKKLSRALDSVRLGGGTVLYEAVNEGLRKVHNGRHDKRAILVISDGLDAGSRRTTVPALVQQIRQSEVLVYGLGTAETLYADPVEHVPFTLPTPQSAARGPVPPRNVPRPNPSQSPSGPRGATFSNVTRGVNMQILTQFAENSGGQAFLLSDIFIKDDASEIDKVLTRIAEELRSQYTLGYYPSTTDKGTIHSVKVTTRGGYTVRTRTGYLAK